jgi:hypothetical protein
MFGNMLDACGAITNEFLENQICAMLPASEPNRLRTARAHRVPTTSQGQPRIQI